MQGEKGGMPMTICHFSYGKKRRFRYGPPKRQFGSRYEDINYTSQTVLYIKPAKLELPDMVVRPERSFDKLHKLVGLQDINFPSHSVFSKEFIVQGNDEGAVTWLLSGTLIEMFEAHPNLSMEVKGNGIILFYRRMTLKPADIPGFMKLGLDIITQLEERQKRFP